MSHCLTGKSRLYSRAHFPISPLDINYWEELDAALENHFWRDSRVGLESLAYAACRPPDFLVSGHLALIT